MPLATVAQTAESVGLTQETAAAAGISGNQDLIQIIGRIINVFLGLLGIVFLVLLLYAGYMYMTSAGDKEKVQKALSTIRNAVIGLVIIASAWAITAFILGFFAGEGGGLGGSRGTRPPAVGLLPGSSGSLGSGIIESVLPEPNSKDNPRNTPIFVTFKEPIYPASFITDWTEATSNTVRGLNSDVVKIYRVDSGVATALSSDKARVFYTQDLKTFVIKPVEYLGSPTVNVGYKVELKGGSSGVLKNAGTHPAAFTGAFSSGYNWQFEVSTLLDLTPPVVVATIPPNTGGQFARNIVVQLNFNKAMDPTTVSGKTAQFSNIEVLAGANGNPPTTPVVGEFKISNHYKTVEFLTDSKCGTNSCGIDVYCLPANASIQVTAKAATVDSGAPPQAILTNNGYDGVVSAVGNSLDGSKIGGDGKADGPPGDNFVASFSTSDQIKLEPPKIEKTFPDADPTTGGNSNIPLDQPVVASFDSLLQSSTINSDNAQIDAHGIGETDPDKFWYMAGMRLLNEDGSDFNYAAEPPTIPTKAAIVLTHRPYLPSGTGVENLNFYDPYLYSGIQDAYQNCFNPAAKCGTGSGNPNCCKNSPTAEGCKNILKTP